MVDRLVAWLYGTPVLTLSPTPNNRISFEWRPEGIERWGRGSRVLSISLPLDSPVSPRDDRVLDFFSNLLPDGPALVAMAQIAGVSPIDTFGLLRIFGAECAGAVTLLEEGHVPTDSSAWGEIALSDVDLARIIDRLPTSPLGADIDDGWTPSLAGYQGKIPVGRLTSGQWTRPTGGGPSTWILKPDRDHPMAKNEFTCLRLATAAGFDVPEVELLDLNGMKILAIKRYDRTRIDAGILRRHQEDGCQATATPPMQKYEHAGGPSLKTLAKVLKDHAAMSSEVELLRRVVFNVIIGNADAHAKNFSLLHEGATTSIRIAPVYDVLSTLSLPNRVNTAGVLVSASTTMGQLINGLSNIEDVTSNDLVVEATTWGVRPTTAHELVREVIESVAASLHEIDGDDEVLEVIRVRTERLLR